MVLHSDICIGLREYGRTLEHVPGESLHQRVSLLILGHECCWTMVGRIGS